MQIVTTVVPFGAHAQGLTRRLTPELGHDRVAAPAAGSPTAAQSPYKTKLPTRPRLGNVASCRAPHGSGPALLDSDSLPKGQKVNTQFTTKRSNGCNAMEAGPLRGRHADVEQSTWFNSRARIEHWLPFRFRRERRHRAQHCVRSSCSVGRTGSGFRPGRASGDTSGF